jgi:hypothetical protein
VATLPYVAHVSFLFFLEKRNQNKAKKGKKIILRSQNQTLRKQNRGKKGTCWVGEEQSKGIVKGLKE